LVAELQLSQEAHVILVEQPDVIDPVAKHGESFDANAHQA
jgi:hypothetical protein